MGYEARGNPSAAKFAGPADTLDARGRILQVDDELILHTSAPIYFRVAEITPNLDPAAPPGLILVHIGCMATFIAKRGQVNAEFVRVRTAAEAGPSPFKLLDAKEQKPGEGEDAPPTPDDKP
jgi:hypothetical protein